MSKIYATALPPVPVLNGWHTDEEVEQATRILILHLLGGFLFPDTTKNKVKLFFLNFLNTFEGCGQYSWGSAVLAYLYRAMCRAADFESSTACGCLILLQIWAWQRLPMVRPQGILPLNNLGDLPYGARWFCPHEWPIVTTHVIRAYRDQFDHCTERKFEFRPYDDILPYLPYYCRDGAGMWTSQFRGVQNVPQAVPYRRDLHAIDGRSSRQIRDWRVYHGEYVDLWDDRHNYYVAMIPIQHIEVTGAYKVWFYRYGRRVIGNPAHDPHTGYVEYATELHRMTHGFRAISLESTTTLDDPTIDRDATLTRINNISLDNLGEHNFIVNVPDEDYYAARQEDIVQARRSDRRRERRHMRSGLVRGGRVGRGEQNAFSGEQYVTPSKAIYHSGRSPIIFAPPHIIASTPRPTFNNEPVYYPVIDFQTEPPFDQYGMGLDLQLAPPTAPELQEEGGNGPLRRSSRPHVAPSCGTHSRRRY
ncbi:serine/threonine-protein phosphatase 7 long form homolog isoform X2 [Ipomoea triloba]|uniref:serine/threonine-protein phosphatase 7 long form homolog isoform X2 n=1 Tax=Ipomoea triloba TaxID=35885 RepID=UPI00125D173C|nr:serine/threonine-protein phosphatase 7 long form homolog isoform X2 [Ipomoea triloba]